MSDTVARRLSGMLTLGNERLIMSESVTGSGSLTIDFDIQSDTVLLSLYAGSVTGTLDVTAYTIGDGEEPLQAVSIIQFPQLTGPTTGLLLRKAAAALDSVRVTVVYSGSADFEIRAKAISTGEASVTIKGQSTAKASQQNVSGVTELIPASLEDRAGLIVRNNNSGTGILYLGFTLLEAVPGVGYPIYPGESLGLDIAGGQSIYAVASTGTVDVRILEAGGNA